MRRTGSRMRRTKAFLSTVLPGSRMRRTGSRMRRTKAAAIDTRDWAEGLSTELLGCILDHVTAQGHARFAAVCTSWRSAVKEAVNSRRPPPAQRPWVFIWTPYSKDIWKDIRACRYSCALMLLSDGKYPAVHPKLPRIFHRTRLAGLSPDGCVVIIDYDRLFQLHAFNLLSGARLRLPPFRTIPLGYPEDCTKVAMSSPGLGGAGPGTFMALLHNGSQQPRAVAVARAGDEKWSILDTTALTIIRDVAYHEGTFYVLGGTRAEEEQVCIAIVPCGGVSHHLSSPPEIMVVGPIHQWEFEGFLVWSVSGDLLLVVYSLCSEMFAVSRLDFVPDGEGGRKIEMSVQLRDLGEQALVVGRQCCMAVSTLQVPQLKRNRVYFICNQRLTMYNLEDDSKEFWDVPCLGMNVAATWFFPYHIQCQLFD